MFQQKGDTTPRIRQNTILLLVPKTVKAVGATDEQTMLESFRADDDAIDSNWIYGQEALDGFAKLGLVYITQDNYIRRIVKDERTKMLKDLLSRVGADGEALPYYTFDINLNNGGWGTNEDANDELHQLLGQQYVFDFSKPTRLIAKLIQSVTKGNDIVLDFFSGSAATADAVIHTNSAANNKNRYVEKQLSENDIDVILSHTCPFKYEPREMFLPTIDQSTVDASTEKWLDRIEESTNYIAWFCGHWHTDKRIDKMHFLFHSFESEEQIGFVVQQDEGKRD